MAVYIFSFFVRGAVGFGSAMPAVLLTSWLLPAHHAVILALLAGLVSQGQFLAQGIRGAEWPIARSVTLSLVGSITVGVLLFKRLDADWLLLLLGVLCFLLVLLGRPPVVDRTVRRWGRHAGAIAGGISGFVGTVIGAGGMYLLVVYLRHVCAGPAQLRATNIVVSAVFLFWRAVVAALAGLVTWQILSEVVVLLPAIIFGGWLGARWFRSLDAERFGQVLQAILLIASLGLVIRGGLRVMAGIG
ncbi:sulfite exporter TauE/SafE family protein [Jannaschia formosa]|uniref:sulfite exporter TauE/SafE family protein n=1 Tax=Jannaschia formosa TaxID=2259592 RepID=UPI00142FB18D|nr:sulfite exporter TauE/SafE family protein [Jannaschia formosa]